MFKHFKSVPCCRAHLLPHHHHHHHHNFNLHHSITTITVPSSLHHSFHTLSPSHFSDYETEQQQQHEDDDSQQQSQPQQQRPIVSLNKDPTYRSMTDVFKTYNTQFNTILSKSRQPKKTYKTKKKQQHQQQSQHQQLSLNQTIEQEELQHQQRKYQKSSSATGVTGVTGAVSQEHVINHTTTTTTIATQMSNRHHGSRAQESRVLRRQITESNTQRYANENFNRLFGTKRSSSPSTSSTSSSISTLSSSEKCSSPDDSFDFFVSQTTAKTTKTTTNNNNSEQQLNQLVEKLFSVSTESAVELESIFQNSILNEGDPIDGDGTKTVDGDGDGEDGESMMSTMNHNRQMTVGGQRRNNKFNQQLINLLRTNKQLELDDSVFNATTTTTTTTNHKTPSTATTNNNDNDNISSSIRNAVSTKVTSMMMKKMSRASSTIAGGENDNNNMNVDHDDVDVDVNQQQVITRRNKLLESDDQELMMMTGEEPVTEMERNRQQMIHAIHDYIRNVNPEFMRPPPASQTMDNREKSSPMISSLLRTAKQSVQLNERQYEALERAFIQKHFTKKIVLRDNVPQNTIELANPEQEIDREIIHGVTDDFSLYEAPSHIDFDALAEEMKQKQQQQQQQESAARFLNDSDVGNRQQQQHPSSHHSGLEPKKIAYDSLGYQYVPTNFEDHVPFFAVDTDRVIRRKPATAKSEIDMLLGDLESEEELEMVRTQRSLFGETREGAAMMNLQGEATFNPKRFEKLDLEEFKKIIFFPSSDAASNDMTTTLTQYSTNLLLSEVVDEEEIEHRRQDEEYSSILDEGYLSLQQLKSSPIATKRTPAPSIPTVVSTTIRPEDEDRLFKTLLRSYEEEQKQHQQKQ